MDQHEIWTVLVIYLHTAAVMDIKDEVMEYNIL